MKRIPRQFRPDPAPKYWWDSYKLEPDPDHTVEAIRTLMAYKRELEREKPPMQRYIKTVVQEVYARQVGIRETITIHHEGHGSSGDSKKVLTHGDYIVYNPDFGIEFLKKEDFDRKGYKPG